MKNFLLMLWDVYWHMGSGIGRCVSLPYQRLRNGNFVRNIYGVSTRQRSSGIDLGG